MTDSRCQHYKAALADIVSGLCESADVASNKDDRLLAAASAVVRCARLVEEEQIFDKNDNIQDAETQNMQLRVENIRMQSQIDDLVRDRLQLLDRLQENASDESDKKGIRLVGLSVGHLDMVRSYVNTLSEGSIPKAISTQQSFVHLSERLPDARRIEGGLQQTALQKEHFARILQLENELDAAQ